MIFNSLWCSGRPAEAIKVPDGRTAGGGGGGGGGRGGRGRSPHSPTGEEAPVKNHEIMIDSPN